MIPATASRVRTAAVIVIGFWIGVAAQAPGDPSLQSLYERHSWFELRGAIAGKTVSPLYAGAVASAFNRTADAERYFNRAIREASATEAATEAREALVNLYMRMGRSSDMSLLRPANVFSKPVGNDLQHGNLGIDVLSQAAEVRIDFQAMSLTLH